ncbi:hypothetical protein Q5752_000053 [Cryptotrichosporon argae]
MPAPIDVVIALLSLLLPLAWYYRESLPIIGGRPRASAATAKGAARREDAGDPRDFVGKMERANKRCVMFYGSQTGTAEEYTIRLAKEAKARFGISSLVCDPEEYDFTHLDRVPASHAVFFVVATYGEGDPTDNAQALFEFLADDEAEFSGGGTTLEDLHYVVFGLGNKTYELYQEAARKLDRLLQAKGAKRIGERGEGDDDKSMEEDYLAWKDGMWSAFGAALGVEEGGAGDVADFEVTEVADAPADKVYHGELSARALLANAAAAAGTAPPAGSYNAKNPYPAPVLASKELFAVSAERNCVHIEFDIADSGISYQHGDHVGVWPSNPDAEVDRALAVLGLAAKRQTVINVDSLDPALAKVPFPVPATYEAVFRHYLDISAVASRQTIAFLARYAPTSDAAQAMTRWGTDRAAYEAEVAGPALKLAEVLQAAAGDDTDPDAAPFPAVTKWPIPFDRIVSTVPRLQPRYYSISSSAKLHPTAIHVTAVVLKYAPAPSPLHRAAAGAGPRYVFGLSTNFILNVSRASSGANTPVLEQGTGGALRKTAIDKVPSYRLAGPRNTHFQGAVYRVPIHVRRSTFRLPTSPKVPVIMIGPGTGVAPFRGFVQERVALARRAVEKAGAGALADWAPMHLFYGCRRADEDFLYRDEWDGYAAELGGKFAMHTAFSRGPDRKPDGSKIYVQDLIWEQRATLAPLILDKRAYVYICGDAKSMAKAVEDRLMALLAEHKGGRADVEGAKELKTLKERNRLMLDVWS